MTEKQEKLIKVLTRIAGGDLDLVIAGLDQGFESVDDVAKWILMKVIERENEKRCKMFGVDP